MTDPTPLPFHLDDGIIRASDGTWCYPANGTEKDLFAALAVSAADNAALRQRVEELEAALRGLLAVADDWQVGLTAREAARDLLSQPKDPK